MRSAYSPIISLLIPGIGQALAVESLLTTLLGSGMAAMVGGLYGALQAWLVPEEQAKIGVAEYGYD